MVGSIRMSWPIPGGSCLVQWRYDDYVLVNGQDRKSTRLNSSHMSSSYAVFCLKKKTEQSARRPTASSQTFPANRACNDAMPTPSRHAAATPPACDLGLCLKGRCAYSCSVMLSA